MNINVEDAKVLIDYLRAQGRIGEIETPFVHVLAGGVSNRAVLVRRGLLRQSDWVIKQALAKLRVDADWFCDPARVHREALGLRWLNELLPSGSVPRFVFEDDEQHLLAMEAVALPHENWKSRLLVGQLEMEYVKQFAHLLAVLHRHSHQRRDELKSEFADRSFFESLRLEPYYVFTSTEVNESAEFLTELIRETKQRRWTLVHGDFSPKNILIRNRRLVLLDHEVIHWGDPAFDVGFAMTHLLSKANHLPGHRNAFAVAARTFWNDYLSRIGSAPWHDDLQPQVVRHTLGCLLARVAGRSPLEYLSRGSKERQRHVVLRLVQDIPKTVDELVARFIEGLGARGNH